MPVAGELVAEGGQHVDEPGVRRPLGSDGYPALDASSDEVRRYFVDNETEVRALSFFHTLAALALLGFSAYLQTALRQDAERRGGLPSLEFAGGVAAAVFLLLSAVFIACSPSPRSPRTPLSRTPCWWRPTSRAVPPSQFRSRS